jgi:sigma-B regulation protein RsbU (phosphoserine phosphatase)
MQKDNHLRVVIADDQPLIRSGLEAFLMVFGEMRLVGEAQDGNEVLELCELVEPDVVLMDVEMPRMDGLAAARLISQRWPKIKVILLGDSKEQQEVQRALDAGAATYLTKDIAADDLAQAIRKLFQGLRPVRRSQPSRPAQSVEKIAAAMGKPKLTQELEAAGKIQADLLPASPPQLPGWEMSATLEPARETSGDFFDFIPLANGNWGIVIADVTDKGMGAALFMALCSTLIRTYATQYPALPALSIATVNDRILSDSRGDMFVTVFFGVLEPDTGRLRYVNAGHNPPYLFSFKKSKPVESLSPTGMALGVLPDMHWEQKIVKFNPGDLLLLYTDGITEAQDVEGRFFGSQRLLKIARALHGRPALAVQDAILSEVNCFCGAAPRADDIALMTVVRK